MKAIIYSILMCVSCLSNAVEYEPVNCRSEQTGTKNFYEGEASCVGEYAYSTCPSGIGSCHVVEDNFVTIRKYIPLQTSNSAQLRELVEQWVTGITGARLRETHLVSCTAHNVPFSHSEAVFETVCDYKPSVEIWHSAIAGSANKHVYIVARDKDGSIDSQELWVNGLKQSGSSTELVGQDGDSFNVMAKVRDNYGYSSSTSRNIILRWNGYPCKGKCPDPF
ncbi:hypothetical protein WLQ65_13590 [Pseudoalteromonas piscicida]|uniref:hypothetical protein n=1 Tax=Pseudoalteromonas piscicida TaxID=43662 RepID=UPI0030C9DABA